MQGSPVSTKHVHFNENPVSDRVEIPRLSEGSQTRWVPLVLGISARCAACLTVTLKLLLIWIFVNRKKLKMSGLEQEAMMSSLMLDKLDKIKVRLFFMLFF